VTAILRFVGILNAAVWLGAALFFTLAAAPAIFSPELKRIFGQAHVGLVAQTVLADYFVLQYWCGGIALAHLLAEWVYLGKPLQRLTTWLVVGLVGLGLLGGLGLQPPLRHWHQVKYSTELFRREIHPAEERARAARLFGLWHGVSQAMNLVVLAGLGVYLWQVSMTRDGTRFTPTAKFRG
jgi:hypothetical protein